LTIDHYKTEETFIAAELGWTRETILWMSHEDRQDTADRVYKMRGYGKKNK